MEEKPPPSGKVLVSTKADVHILQFNKGREQMNDPHWMDPVGRRSDIQFKEVIAWAELPEPFNTE
jgi:hypothetical protein